MKIDTILVLAGGKGTRSLNPNIPKLHQEVAYEKDLADILLKELDSFASTKVIWLLSHLSEDLLARISPLPPNHEVYIDQGIGTSAAVESIVGQIQGQRVMVIMGDCVMGAPLKEITDSLQEGPETVFFGRHTDHPLDSDLLVVDHSGIVSSFIPKGTKVGNQNGISFGISGLTITTTGVLENLSCDSDIQRSIYFSSLQSQKSVRLAKNSWYIRDIGTPSRLAQVRADFQSGAFKRRASSNRQGIFLDRDGTLIPDIGPGRKKVIAEDVPLLVLQAIARANASGIPVFVVTNQPGLAKGFIDFSELLTTTRELMQVLSPAVIDDFYFCPHHPERGWEGEIHFLKVTCECRKPQPGLLKRAAREHLVNLENSFFLGDSGVDRMAAQAVGMTFVAVEWSEAGTQVAQSIENAVGKICLDNY